MLLNSFPPTNVRTYFKGKSTVSICGPICVHKVFQNEKRLVHDSLGFTYYTKVQKSMRKYFRLNINL